CMRRFRVTVTIRVMAVGRAARRVEREPRVVAVFGDQGAARALDLLELLEYAWHDCYGEVSPSEEIIDDILLLSEGRIDGLIEAARLAVTDWRDVRLAAEGRRNRTYTRPTEPDVEIADITLDCGDPEHVAA